jgi:hypothetical protein
MPAAGAISTTSEGYTPLSTAANRQFTFRGSL